MPLRIRFDEGQWTAIDGNGKVRRLYTVGQIREAINLYKDNNIAVAEIARKMSVPRKTAANWIRRHRDDPYFAARSERSMWPLDLQATVEAEQAIADALGVNKSTVSRLFSRNALSLVDGVVGKGQAAA
jgi:transposase-like protein